MIVLSFLVCSIVPLAAGCESHGTLSLLVMETCVHSAVYAQPLFFFIISLTQSAYRLCCYHRVVRASHPMYRFWLYLALHVYDHPKSAAKSSSFCLYFLRKCGCCRHTDRQTDRETDGRTDPLFITQIPSGYLSSSSTSTNDVSRLSSVLNN